MRIKNQLNLQKLILCNSFMPGIFSYLRRSQERNLSFQRQRLRPLETPCFFLTLCALNNTNQLNFLCFCAGTNTWQDIEKCFACFIMLVIAELGLMKSSSFHNERCFEKWFFFQTSEYVQFWLIAHNNVD